MRLFSLILMVTMTVGCSAMHKKDPQPAPHDVKSELAKIEIDINTGAHKKAIARLENIAAKHADTDAADDAYIMLGDLYFKNAAYNESYKAYISVLNSEVYSPREEDASTGAANALYKLGRYDEALSLTTNSLKKKPTSPATRVEIFTLRYNIQTQLGDRLDALRSLIYLTQETTDATKKEPRHVGTDAR